MPLGKRRRNGLYGLVPRTAFGAVRAGIRAARFVARARRNYQMRRSSNLPTPRYPAGARKRRMANRFGRNVRRRVNIRTAMASKAAGPGNELIQRYNTTHRRPISIRRLAGGAFMTKVDVWQSISNFDTDQGRVLFRNAYTSAANTAHSIPVYITEITNIDNNTGSAVPNRNAMEYLGWDDVTNTANLTSTVVGGQDQNGNPGISQWQTVQGPRSNMDVGKIYLKYLQAEFNFYGARKRSTRFQVHLVTFNDVNCDPVLRKDSVGSRQFITELERPLMYSNMSIGNSEWKKRVKIIKTWSYNVAPTTSIDLNTTTGKICHAKLFIGINKLLTMRGPQGTDQANHFQTPSFTEYAGPQNSPHPKARMFLIITAFCPERIPFGTALTAEETPSMDVILRRKMLIPNGINASAV